MKIKEKDGFEWLTLVEPFQDGSADQQIPHFLEYISLLKEGEAYNPKAESSHTHDCSCGQGVGIPGSIHRRVWNQGFSPVPNLGEEPPDREEERRLF